MTARYIAIVLTVVGCLAASPVTIFAATGSDPLIRYTGARRTAFNDGWRFLLGGAPNAEQPGFNDDSWSPVRLPHDWAIAGPFDPTLDPQTGALPISGIAWYRKSFTLPADDGHRYYSVEFDGVMSNARVWLNGHELGGRPYGYIGFAFDLTPYLLFGGKRNVLAVRLAGTQALAFIATCGSI
jgi:beta-galactosidase